MHFWYITCLKILGFWMFLLYIIQKVRCSYLEFVFLHRISYSWVLFSMKSDLNEHLKGTKKYIQLHIETPNALKFSLSINVLTKQETFKKLSWNWCFHCILHLLIMNSLAVTFCHTPAKSYPIFSKSIQRKAGLTLFSPYNNHKNHPQEKSNLQIN